MKVAIVQDWLTDMGGAEKVLKCFLELFPDADMYALVATEEAKKSLGLSGVTESFICHLPFGRSQYRKYLQLFPLAIEGFDMSKYDLILSSSSSAAKGVLTFSNQLHICYCHTPARYVWDLTWNYMSMFTKGRFRFSPLKLYMRRVFKKFRMWDVVSSNRVDHFIANSEFVARRIKKIYNRDSVVIYPPVNVTALQYDPGVAKEDYYFTVSRLVSYKRVDLIVEAFNRMPDKTVYIAGDGKEGAKLKRMAGKNVHFLGRLSDEELHQRMQRAKGFVFAAEEDFGIAPVEAQACGVPVICYGKGGTTETIIDGETGVYFKEQTADALCDAVGRFEGMTFDAVKCRRNAERFSTERFKKEIMDFVEAKRAAMES